MRLLALCAATAIAATVSFAVNAADIAYPAPVLGHPQHGVAPQPAAAPPQVIILPGPTPQYNTGTSAPPPMAGPSPYGLAPPVAPRVDLAPRTPCPPIWRCGDRGCGWQQPGCAPPPEEYPGPYASPGPQVYSGPAAPPASEPYPGPYAPQLYPGPNAPAAGNRSLYRP